MQISDICKLGYKNQDAQKIECDMSRAVLDLCEENEELKEFIFDLCEENKQLKVALNKACSVLSSQVTTVVMGKDMDVNQFFTAVHRPTEEWVAWAKGEEKK